MIDKIIYGTGANGFILKPKKFTRQETLDAGQYRFEKDGLWVVGQEDSWQEGNRVHHLRMEALGQFDASALPTHPNAVKQGFRR